MRAISLLQLLSLSSISAAKCPIQPSHILSNPPADDPAWRRIPTSYESAVMGRRILELVKLGDIATTFPSPSSASVERRPPGLEGQPIGLMDYIGTCEEAGNPTLLAIKIATYFKNAEKGSNTSLSVRWMPPHPPERRISLFSRLASMVWADDSPPDTVPYSAANLPRFSLMGYLEPIEETAGVADCFVAKHPDARFWLPGNRIHESEWVRLVVTQVYWIGGFGDRAYIGWIPIEEWRNVTREEWERIRLPGEKKGWSEWNLGGAAMGDL